jgi:hypothetical protein
VSNARLILIILLCASPVVLLLDAPITHGLVAGIVASGLVMVAGAMRPVETSFFLSIARPTAAFAALPALWMLIQVLPLHILAHPDWQSAETAIGRPLGGAISVDIGASVMAIGQYLTVVAIGLWSCAVAVDRLRAEWLLFSLLAATVLIALLVIANSLLGSILLGAGAPVAQAVDCVAIGLVVAAAAALRTSERYETRHASPHRSVPFLIKTFAACVAAFVVGLGALLLAAPGAVSVAAGYGVATLAAIVTIRRLGFGPWGIAGVVVPAVVLAIALAAGTASLRTTNLSLAFAAGSPPSALSIGERMLADAPWPGTGAGTYAAIAPIYGNVDVKAIAATAPTAAAAVTVELGSALCWLVVVANIAAIVYLFRAALRRGRDSFYAAAGAGGLVALLFLFFINAGSLGSAAATIAAALVGLAFAQSKSRTVR